MRSATSADCVGDPPGELTSSATAASPSGAKARSSVFSTAAALITERGTGPEIAAITPCRRTSETTGRSARSPSLPGSFDASRLGSREGSPTPADA